MQTIAQIIDRGASARSLIYFREGHNALPAMENCTRYFFGEGFTWLPGYDDITAWIADSGGKGLLLMGGIGVGKTVFATRIIPYMIKERFGKIVSIFQAMDMLEKEREIKRFAIKVIDDIGVERPEPYSGREVFSDIVAHAEFAGQFLILTTNLTGDGIRQRYGLRTYDRLKALCKPVYIQSNKSYRV